MPIEIERKFLLRDDSWRTGAEGEPCVQTYIPIPGGVLRFRALGERGFITVKGRKSGISKPEFEYPIPVEEAREMIDLFAAGKVIDKTRYHVDFHGFTWVIDEFHGDNQGLVVTEIELEDENQAFPRPPWLGAEVSHDSRFANSNLLAKPFSKW